MFNVPLHTTLDPLFFFFFPLSLTATTLLRIPNAPLVQGGRDSFVAHFDCHETTDTDVTEFQPAKEARDGAEWTKGTVPDGFYLVGNTALPQTDFHTAVIDSVRQVTHVRETRFRPAPSLVRAPTPHYTHAVRALTGPRPPRLGG